MVWIVCSLLLVTASIVDSEPIMEAKIHKGVPVKTHKYSYAVFISVKVEKNSTFLYYCGSSLINQRMLLTAAHCFSFKKNLALVLAFAGHYNYTQGQIRTVTMTYTHNNYKKTDVAYDIALALLDHPLNLDRKISRIALTTRFYNGHGEIAGWGINHDDSLTVTNLLHSTIQNVMSRHECLRIISDAPKGTICGGKSGDISYPTEGDSGSALLMFNYVQVGIVSYKVLDYDKTIVVYTDISYFYNWIVYNSARLYCTYKHL